MIRVALFLLIGLGLAGFGAIAWISFPAREAAATPSAKPTKVSVLTMARDIRPGALLQPGDIVAKEFDDASLPPGYVVDRDQALRTLIGGMARRTMAPGDVLRLPQDVLTPGEHGFLAAVLAPGMRAVTVAVDAVSGTAGLIWPGDRVDLILTQTAADPNPVPTRRVSAETVLRDVRVIAIDQQIVQGGGDSREARTARTVTIEVSPPNAEIVQVATRLGHLSLVVRSASAGPEGGDGPGITYSGDVSAANTAQVARPAASSIRVFQGAAEGREFKF